MKSVAHWSPRYVSARLQEIAYQKANPDHPWLTRDAIRLLTELLKPDDTALEFGTGRSTLWFARRVRHITTVDHNAQWHETIKARVEAEGLKNVTLLLHPNDKPDEQGSDTAYVRAADQFAENSLDFVLVDGMYRDCCALAVLPKIKSGGILAIDNASWFLPSHSKSPHSRPIDGPAYSEKWQTFLAEVAGWRRIWTYSGVFATVLFFKP